MLHTLLAVMLLLSITPQTAKKKRGIKPKPIVAAKKTEAPNPGREAIKALKTMSAVAEIGTTYSNYTTRLADVKVQVDELLTKMPTDDPDGPTQPKRYIQMALDSYVSAAHYWEMKIKNKHTSLDASYTELIDLAWQQANNYLNLAAKDLDKKK